jgi:hypothetical protein
VVPDGVAQRLAGQGDAAGPIGALELDTIGLARGRE